MRTRNPFRRAGLPYLLAPLIALAPSFAAEAAAQGVPIAVNDARVGSLSFDDPRDSDGSLYDDYILEVSSSRDIVIDMTSDEFDTYLRLFDLRGGGMRSLATDDDGGDGLNSRLQYQLPGAGRYLIRATSFGSSERTGSYRIDVLEVGAVGAVGDRISVGQSGRGTLDWGDPTVDGGDHYEDWVVSLGSGERIQIDMESDDVDSYLYVGQGLGGNFREIDRDDDGGAGLDASLVFTAPHAGDFVIRASTFSAGQTGPYRLNVMGARGVIREIEVGQTLTGVLDPSDPQSGGKYYDDYVFQASAGQTYRVDLPSDDVDTYLQVGQGAGQNFRSEWSNDDGGDGLDAAITFTPNSSGRYTIRATSFGSDATGSYRISLQATGGGDSRARPMNGSSVNGRLEPGDARDSDGGYYDEWTFQGRDGETVRYSLVSRDFDTLIEFGIGTGSSFHELARDDDGGDGLNSLLTTTLPSTGTFTLRVRSWGGGGTGFYTLERR